MAAPNNLTTSVNVCEDTDKTFALMDILAQAGYTPDGPVVINRIQVRNPDGTISTAPTSLVRMLADGSGFVITASNEQNWNGYFETLNLVVESGNESFSVRVGVTVDPVNDAPEGTDTTIALVDGSGYVLKEADFGFRDQVEGDGFKSVVISSLPTAGQLSLNGVALAAGAEVGIADIRAGRLVYMPPSGGAAPISFGFQVRDDGGTEGCDASDLDGTPNQITFELPLLGSLGDRVWFDADRDGVQDAGEAGVAGISVRLKGAGSDGVFGTADDINRTTSTDAQGLYAFTELAAGQYQVTFGTKTEYTFTSANVGDDASDSDADANGVSHLITLGAGEHNNTIDAGLVLKETNTARLGDRVWYDTDRDGVQDGNETGVSGLTVTLAGAGADGVFGTGDDISRTTTTNGTGYYLFDNLAAGQYQVRFGSQTGYQFTSPNVGDDALDSDADANGYSHFVTLGIGESNLTVDAGLVVQIPVDPNNARLGDRVWYDTDRDGTQDSNESGVSGLTVTLAGAGADGVFGTGDDISRTTTTNSTGYYLFDNLAAGQYQVTFGNLAGYNFTTANVGSDTTDSDADANGRSHVVTLGIGESNLTVDAGLVQKDTNKAKLGDRVWYDTDRDGIQDSNESGVSGLTVRLAGAGADGVFGTGDDISRTTTTNSTGYYLFDNLAAGQYQVTFGSLSGYNFTTANVGSDTTDSDADANGRSHVVTLGIGESNLTVDAGLVQKDTNKAKLGDRVWYDTDRDGIQDSNESGVSGLTVRLAGAGADGVFGTGDDISRTTTTNNTGHYLFDNLAAGNYRVTFSGKTGYQFTTANAGSNDAVDSDANATTGVSHTVTLGIGESNLTVDAGLVQKDPMTGKIGDRVWGDFGSGSSYHNGVQDSNETSAYFWVANIRVTLYNATTDTVVASMRTDSAGKYLFTGLAAGHYYVQFDKTGVYDTNVGGNGSSLNSWRWTHKDRGSDDSRDSDVTGWTTANVARTDAFYLAPGQVDLTRDAGLTPIVIDLDGDGIQTIARGASDATFDLFGNGGAVKSGWISGKDGFLAVDRNGNGKIDDISELFGGTAKGAGFAKLASFDSNGDGVVDAQDADFDKLLIWQDVDGNHQTDAGELMTLAQAGVAALTVAYTEQPFLDAQGNLHLERSSATMADGSSVDMTDVYFNVDAADAAAAGVELPTMGELLGVDNALLDQALGGGAAREQAAIADIGFDADNAAQRVIAEAMKQADASLAAIA